MIMISIEKQINEQTWHHVIIAIRNIQNPVRGFVMDSVDHNKRSYVASFLRNVGESLRVAEIANVSYFLTDYEFDT